MKPTGRIDSGTDLVIERTLDAPVEVVWAALTESARLGLWIGTWTGDPSSGSVMFTMNAEPGEATATEYFIRSCEPPNSLGIRATDGFGTWTLSATLTEHREGTRLEFRQIDVPFEAVSNIGPGWEWYLDRLVAVVHGVAGPGLDEFDTVYMPMAPYYDELRAAL